MSIYGGFALRKSEAKYNWCLEQLLCVMQQKIMNNLQKDDEAHLNNFKVKFGKTYSTLRSMEDQKYLPPKFSECVRTLAESLGIDQDFHESIIPAVVADSFNSGEKNSLQTTMLAQNSRTPPRVIDTFILNNNQIHANSRQKLGFFSTKAGFTTPKQSQESSPIHLSSSRNLIINPFENKSQTIRNQDSILQGYLEKPHDLPKQNIYAHKIRLDISHFHEQSNRSNQLSPLISNRSREKLMVKHKQQTIRTLNESAGREKFNKIYQLSPFDETNPKYTSIRYGDDSNNSYSINQLQQDTNSKNITVDPSEPTRFQQFAIGSDEQASPIKTNKKYFPSSREKGKEQRGNYSDSHSQLTQFNSHLQPSISIMNSNQVYLPSLRLQEEKQISDQQSKMVTIINNIENLKTHDQSQQDPNSNHSQENNIKIRSSSLFKPIQNSKEDSSKKTPTAKLKKFK